MKKVQFMIIALLISVSNVMGEDGFVYRSSTEGCDCELQAVCYTVGNDGTGNIEISLSSPDGHQFFAFQMFIVLNEGITLIPDEEEDYGEFVIIPSDRFGNTDKKKAKYGIQIAQKENGYQIVCLNQQGNAILESEGLLLTIPVKKGSQESDIIGEIKEIEFTTLDGKAIRFAYEAITVGIKPTVKDEQSSKTYNLNGQEISGSNKGILIKNRKKVYNK